MTAASLRAEELLAFASSKPEGFTKSEACADLDWGHYDFVTAVNSLRRVLATDELTLVCNPSRWREQWVYELVSGIEDGSPWVRNRLQDPEARFETIGSVATSIVNATDGRTAEGRKARLIEKAIRRLREDLAEIDMYGVSA